MEKIAIVGSRDFNRASDIIRFIDSLSIDTIIVSGCADGADAIALRYGRRMGHEVEKKVADWKRYGRGAGPIRNREIVTSGISVLHVFLVAGRLAGRGSSDCIAQAYRLGIPVIVHQ